jgi:hypothetical protein
MLIDLKLSSAGGEPSKWHSYGKVAVKLDKKL